MSGSPTCETHYLKMMQSHQQEFLDALGKADLSEVLKEMLRSQVLPVEVVNNFASLDENVDSKLKSKYLFQQLYRTIRNDKEAWSRLLGSLASLGENLKEICQLIEKDNVIPQTQNYSEKLDEKNVSSLMSILVDVAHRWKDIGEALKLPTELLEEYEANGLSFPELLHKVLQEWIMGQHEGALPATLQNLKRALECNDDGLSVMAQKLDEKPEPAEEENPAQRKENPVQQEEELEISHQSSDTEVSEGKASLLEVHVTCKSSSLSFQWQKGGKSLAACDAYSDVTCPILFVKASGQTEGEYSCLVSRGKEEVKSRVINLTVKSSQQDKYLMNLYLSLDKALEKSWPLMRSCSFNLATENMQIPYDEVFECVENGTVILVKGYSGAGKTTLAYKLSSDWSKGNTLKQTKMLFLITTGMLGSHKNPKHLADILKLFYSNPTKQNVLLGEMERSFGKGVCFIIDGLDDSCTDGNSQMFFPSLLQKTTLPDAVVIVTSHSIKPTAFASQGSHVKEIELQMLTDEQIFQFVDNFPFQSQSTTCKDVDPFKLTDYIHAHSTVLDFFNLPVHITMACTVHQQQEEYSLTTLTSLYNNFTLAVSHNLGGGEYFKQVCKLAFETTMKKRRVICQHESEAFLTQLSSSLGSSDFNFFLADPISELLGLENVYTFLHQTLQDFLAAYHIAELQPKDREEMIQQHIGEVHVQNAWKFFCGLSHLKGISAACTGMLLPKAGLFEVQCAFESQKITVCDIVIETGKGLVDLSDHTLTTYDLNALCYVISTASAKVTSISMDNCALGDRLVKEMMSRVRSDKLESLAKLSLADNNISSLGVTALAEGLKHSHSLEDMLGNEGSPSSSLGDVNQLNLEELNLSNNNLSSDGAITLIYELRDSLLNLKVLNLSQNNIGSGGAGAIIKDLLQLKRLEDLDLSKNKIDSMSALAIVRALTRARHNLHCLRLQDNFITGDQEDMKEVLSECQTNLEVHLSSSTVLHSAFHSRPACCRIS